MSYSRASHQKRAQSSSPIRLHLRHLCVVLLCLIGAGAFLYILAKSNLPTDSRQEESQTKGITSASSARKEVASRPLKKQGAAPDENGGYSSIANKTRARPLHGSGAVNPALAHNGSREAQPLEPNNASKIRRRHEPRPIEHPSKLHNKFSSDRQWGEDGFSIKEFGGFTFGSSMYCPSGEAGVGMGSAPIGEDGRYTPTDVSRHTSVKLEGGFMGYDDVQVSYTYSSRKLNHLAFTKRMENTQENYNTATSIFYDSIDLMHEKFGMPEPEILVSKGAVYGADDLRYYAGSGNNNMMGQIRAIHDGKIEVFLTIGDVKLQTVANEEGKSAIEKPPTEAIRKWVESFETNPSYMGN